MGPVVAVNFGGVLATSGTATIIRAIGVVAVRVVVLRVTRPRALTFRRVTDVTLALSRRRRRRRGRGLRAANVPRAPATDVALRTRVLGALPVAITIGSARSIVVPGAIKSFTVGINA